MPPTFPPVPSRRSNKPFKSPPEGPDNTVIVNIEGSMTDTKMRWHAKGEDTNGSCAIFEITWNTSDASIHHTHGLEDEAFYLISGRLTIHTPSGDIEVEPGELVWGPRGIRHAYTVGPDGARVLVVQTPGTDLFTFFNESSKLNDMSEEGAYEAWQDWAWENFSAVIHHPSEYPPGQSVLESEETTVRAGS